MQAIETLNRTVFLALNTTSAIAHLLIVAGVLIANYAILAVLPVPVRL